jgi:hypothetical protein
VKKTKVFACRRNSGKPLRFHASLSSTNARERPAKNWPSRCRSCESQLAHYSSAVKFTLYFEAMCQRPDRVAIRPEWYLRVILLSDGETVHNAFFDRSFQP